MFMLSCQYSNRAKAAPKVSCSSSAQKQNLMNSNAELIYGQPALLVIGSRSFLAIAGVRTRQDLNVEYDHFPNSFFFLLAFFHDGLCVLKMADVRPTPRNRFLFQGRNAQTEQSPRSKQP
jgi:hypothetical protein